MLFPNSGIKAIGLKNHSPVKFKMEGTFAHDGDMFKLWKKYICYLLRLVDYYDPDYTRKSIIYGGGFSAVENSIAANATLMASMAFPRRSPNADKRLALSITGC